MSGDVQPRKRKDKKRKREEGEFVPDKPHTPVHTNAAASEDVNIHVHKDISTGGGICAKLVFFVLFSALAVLIGLTITEHRGLTDIETVDPNSKFSQLFEGWVDTNNDNHDEHDEHDIAEHGSVEEDDDHDDTAEFVDHDDEDEDEDEDNVSDEENNEDATEEEDQVDESVEDNENEEEDENNNEEDDEENNNELDDADEDEDEPEQESYYSIKKKIVDVSEENEDNDDDDDDEEIDKDENQDLDEEDNDDEEQIDEKEEDTPISNEKEDTQDQLEDDVDEDETPDKESNEINQDVIKEEEKETANEDQTDDILNETEPEPEEVVESSGMAVKLGVGVALLVVAHLVLVKKWKTVAIVDDKPLEPTAVPNLQDRRNTIINPPPFNEVESDIDQVQEDLMDEEDIEEKENLEANVAKTQYQEIASAYHSDKRSPKAYEYEADDDNYDDEEAEEEEEEDESDDGEEEYDDEVDEEDEDEELLKRLEARYGKLHKDNAKKSVENKNDSDSDKQSEDDYDYDNLTSKEDYKIRKEIDEAQNFVNNNNTFAIALFDKILAKFPSSPRSLYGKARALDNLAEIKRSNNILEEALKLYEKVINLNNVPVVLFDLAAERCINRFRFLGQYKKAIYIHKVIIKKYPDNPKHLNNLGVTYLTINRLEEARSIFKEVLHTWPNNGFALVHYGFILKVADKNFAEAVYYLKKGIDTKGEGVIDGRFYFHLGDALARLGKTQDAIKVYEEGTENKVFLSKYQRSLYNVPRLTAKPWWSIRDLPYSKSFKILLDSWKKIKEEGIAILNESGYFQEESENLKDTGDWKQYELFARGQKNVKNCKKCPFTCSIIDQIPEAKSCKRGQTKFSVMHPGTHVWPHCGPTNCRLRIHLGLKVPKDTYIRVAEETKSWKEGEVLIFDDSFEHEVWHNGSEFRLVLIVDVWHPELTPSERYNLSPI